MGSLKKKVNKGASNFCFLTLKGEGLNFATNSKIKKGV